MKVTEKKLDDGRILLEAVASTAEVSHALTAAQYRFAQQRGVQPAPGMSVEQAVEKQLGIKDLDAIVQQQAVEYLVPFAIDKRNITPAFPALPKAAGPLKRGQTFSFEVRVTPKPDYELKSYEPVSITVPPFEIEQAEVEEQKIRTAGCDLRDTVSAGIAFKGAIPLTDKGGRNKITDVFFVFNNQD